MQQICSGERFHLHRHPRAEPGRGIPKKLFFFLRCREQATKQQQQKFWPNEPGGRARLFFLFLFLLFIYFIYFINSIQFRYLRTSLKDARTRRLPESTARSSRARSHGLTLSVRLCDPYVLARPRTTSTDAPRNLNPSMLVPSQQKDQKNQKKIQKNERKSFWTLAVTVTSQCRI